MSSLAYFFFVRGRLPYVKPIKKNTVQHYSGIFSEGSSALDKLIAAETQDAKPFESKIETKKREWMEKMKAHIEKKKQEYIECNYTQLFLLQGIRIFRPHL